MKLFFTMALTLFLNLPAPLLQAEPAGLVRSGEGEIRYLGIFRIYSAELFVEEGVELNMVLDHQTSRCLKIHYTVEISADDLVKGADSILRRQYPQEYLRRVQHLIDRLHAAYGDIADGDSYTLCYDADTITNTLYFNGNEVASIPSAELGTVYFGIWLAQNRPLDAALRDDLLRRLSEVR